MEQPQPGKRPTAILTRDRLSELPDLALVHVLSRLYTHEAARSSVLSKRFNSLCNSVDSLRFSDEYSGKFNADFVRFVDSALGFFSRTHLNKFIINFNYDVKLKKCVSKWIKFVAQKQVRTLNLNFSLKLSSSRSGYRLPNFFYNNAQLEELVTSCCDFGPKGEINWSKLKLLSITQTRLSKELISNILRGCNVLETLELKYWTGFDELKIDSPSLRVLRIVGERCPKYLIRPGDDCVLEISGPNLFSLEVLGVLYRTKLRMTDVGNLVNAVMDFEIRPYYSSSSKSSALWCAMRDQDIVREVLESLCLVKALTFGGFCVQVLSRYEAFHLSSPWSERSSLTLCIPVVKWDRLGIASLLHSSPYLETLVIRLTYCSPTCVFEHGDTSQNDSTEELYWKLPSTVSRCPLMHLKTVKVVGFQVSCRSMKPLFQFLVFLLSNAKVLEDVVFETTRYATREALDEAQKLLGIETASPDVVVQFEPPHLWIDPHCMYQKPASL